MPTKNQAADYEQQVEFDVRAYPGNEDADIYNAWHDAVADAAFAWAERNSLDKSVLLKAPHANGWHFAYMQLMYMGGIAYRDLGVAEEGIGAWARGLNWHTQLPEDRIREVGRYPEERD